MTLRGLGPRSRERLAALLRKRPGTVTPAEAAEILRVPNQKAARLLGAWVRSGWHVIVAYVIGFMVMLAVQGWVPQPKHMAPGAKPAAAVPVPAPAAAARTALPATT